MSLTDSSTDRPFDWNYSQSIYGYNHVSVIKKISKILSHEVGNVITMVVDNFRSTEINFWSIPTHEGSIPVSDTVLVHFEGSQVESGVKKSVWVNSLVTRDHARTIISELSQGSLGTKIALKTALEGVITTRNGRVASVVSRRCTQSPIWPPGAKYWQRNR